jgi:hypothetical protein
LGQLVDNFNIYARNPAVKLSCEKIVDKDELEKIIQHVETGILSDEALQDSAFIGYCRWSSASDKWLEFRVERPHLVVSALDCIGLFLSSEERAVENVDKLLQLAADMARLESVKEIVGRSRGRITFFVGEPYLLYRPRLLSRFFKGYGFDDAIEPFWKMYRSVSENFPHDEVLDLLKASSVEFRELGGGKILARFCRALDEVEVDGKEVFRDVGKIVDRVLKDRGIRKEW